MPTHCVICGDELRGDYDRLCPACNDRRSKELEDERFIPPGLPKELFKATAYETIRKIQFQEFMGDITKEEAERKIKEYIDDAIERERWRQEELAREKEREAKKRAFFDNSENYMFRR